MPVSRTVNGHDQPCSGTQELAGVSLVVHVDDELADWVWLDLRAPARREQIHR